MLRNLGSNVSDFWQYFEHCSARPSCIYENNRERPRLDPYVIFLKKMRRNEKRKRKEGKKEKEEEREGNARTPYL